jgi:hypothetical protein
MVTSRRRLSVDAMCGNQLEEPVLKCFWDALGYDFNTEYSQTKPAPAGTTTLIRRFVLQLGNIAKPFLGAILFANAHYTAATSPAHVRVVDPEALLTRIADLFIVYAPLVFNHADDNVKNAAAAIIAHYAANGTSALESLRRACSTQPNFSAVLACIPLFSAAISPPKTSRALNTNRVTTPARRIPSTALRSGASDASTAATPQTPATIEGAYFNEEGERLLHRRPDSQMRTVKNPAVINNVSNN